MSDPPSTPAGSNRSFFLKSVIFARSRARPGISLGIPDRAVQAQRSRKMCMPQSQRGERPRSSRSQHSNPGGAIPPAFALRGQECEKWWGVPLVMFFFRVFFEGGGFPLIGGTPPLVAHTPGGGGRGGWSGVRGVGSGGSGVGLGGPNYAPGIDGPVR